MLVEDLICKGKEFHSSGPATVKGQSIECTNLNSFLKNVVNCHTFKDFNLTNNQQNKQQKIGEFYLFLTIDFIRFYQNYIL